MIEAIQTYYEGERNGAVLGGGIAFCFFLFGLYCILRQSGFFAGMGWPFLLVGALVSIFCVFYFRNLGASLVSYSDLFQKKPDDFFSKELPHIVGALRSLQIAIWTELSLILAGAVIQIAAHFKGSTFMKGIGFALVIAFLCTAMLDFSNRERAFIYKQEILSRQSGGK